MAKGLIYEIGAIARIVIAGLTDPEFYRTRDPNGAKRAEYAELISRQAGKVSVAKLENLGQSYNSKK